MKKRMLGLLTLLVILSTGQSLLCQNNIEITPKRNADKSVDFNYTKKLPGSYYLKIKFPTLENSYQTEYEGIIKNSSGRLFKLEPINKEQHINFSYSVSSIRGNPNPKIDENFLYILPFKSGTSVTIKESTSLKEEYFHAKKDSAWNSFIVDRIGADTIYSMRKGLVIDVIDQFKTDSLALYKYTSNLNQVVIEHEDGTVSSYKGFSKKSIFVEPGQIVYPQTKLGVLDLFNKSLYRLYFDVSYLKQIEVASTEKRTLSSEDQSQHLNPYFYSSNGKFTLKNNHEYLVEIDENVRLREFTRREKKQYKKSPKKFE